MSKKKGFYWGLIKMEKTMRIGTLISMALWAAIFSMVGCTSAGAGLEARLGYYREDERAQSSAARYEQSAKPFKCWFVNCDPASNVEGS